VVRVIPAIHPTHRLWDVGTGAVHWSEELHRIHGVDPAGFAGTINAHLELVHGRRLEQTGMTTDQGKSVTEILRRLVASSTSPAASPARGDHPDRKEGSAGRLRTLRKADARIGVIPT
jgi:hypothetical protein